MLGATGTLETRLHPRLEQHKDFFEKHVKELKQSTDRAVLRYRRDIVDRQLVLERLANMAIEMFATGCVISRTQSLIEEKGEDGAEREISLCDLFCVESGLRFRQCRDTLGALSEATDAKKRTVAADVREAAGYFVPDAILEIPAPDKS
jgi:acyl-CoA dehydrogenase family protein 9